MTTYDVAVIGAGVAGVATAWTLHRAGLRVAVLERGHGPAGETSYANGALVTPSMSDPWAAPGLPLQLLRWLGREDAPFLLRPGALPGMWRWGLDFLRQCNRAAWERNASRVHALSDYSQRCLGEVLDAEGLADCVASVGNLRAFTDGAALLKAYHVAEFLRGLGVRSQRLDPSQCAALEPALVGRAATLAGGIHYPDDQHGDCRAFTDRLTGALEQVDWHWNRSVHGIESGPRAAAHALITNAGTLCADRVVIATGLPEQLLLPAERRLARCCPVKGYSVTLRPSPGARLPAMPVVDDARKVGVVPLGDRIRLVGTAEFCGHDRTLTRARCDNLINAASALFPAVADAALDEAWCGLRPMSPDGAPYIGQLPRERVYVNAGHGHLGWTNAFGAARLLGDLITGRPPAIDPEAYRPRAI